MNVLCMDLQHLMVQVGTHVSTNRSCMAGIMQCGLIGLSWDIMVVEMSSGNDDMIELVRAYTARA